MSQSLKLQGPLDSQMPQEESVGSLPLEVKLSVLPLEVKLPLEVLLVRLNGVSLEVAQVLEVFQVGALRAQDLDFSFCWITLCDL